eukprot:gnl/Trimastix_PCT/183.p1 GENE.gnl/Trimastix_PCT/183~~gnl/Trimastix_PCT/183.p1  ORF type:complete len:595 (+),score=241.80 gnl/Trimastix_PCT/183:45-1829(+)
MGAICSKLPISVPGLPSNPLDEDKQRQLREMCQEFLETFGKTYLLEYAQGMLKKARKEYLKRGQQPEPNYGSLLVWDKLPSDDGGDDPVKEGWITFEGKRKYLVLTAGYNLLMFDSEEQAHSNAKAKGDLCPLGYKIYKDPASKERKILEKVAKSFGMDLSELPGVKSYPDHSLYIFRKRRTSWVITLENSDEHKEWYSLLKYARKHADLDVGDKVAWKAFKKALDATRWELGYYRRIEYLGKPFELLSDVLVDHIDHIMMTDVYRAIEGAWAIRMKVRSIVIALMDKIVQTAVNAAWSAAQRGIEAVRPEIQAKLNDAIAPILEVRDRIASQIVERANHLISPVVDEIISPWLQPIFDVFRGMLDNSYTMPMSHMSDLLRDMAQKIASEGLNSGKPYKTSKRFCKRYHWAWCNSPWWQRIEPSYDYIDDELKKKLKQLDRITGNVPKSWFREYPRLNKNWVHLHTIYTFETDLGMTLKANESLLSDRSALAREADRIAQQTFSRCEYDARLNAYWMLEYYINVILWEPFYNKCAKPVFEVIKDLEDLIPEPFRKVLDISGTLKQVLKDIFWEQVERLAPPPSQKPGLPYLLPQ